MKAGSPADVECPYCSALCAVRVYKDTIEPGFCPECDAALSTDEARREAKAQYADYLWERHKNEQFND